MSEIVLKMKGLLQKYSRKYLKYNQVSTLNCQPFTPEIVEPIKAQTKPLTPQTRTEPNHLNR